MSRRDDVRPLGESDHGESIRIIHAALDAGINFVDTADVYSAGESEEIVGKALKGRRENVVLASKLYMPVGDDADPNRRGTSRRWIIQAVENSLRRLGTDWIDLYQVHRPTPDIDLAETLGALTDLVHQGKVRYVGHSTYPASLIVEAQWVAHDHRLQRFVTEQPPYSILTRGVENEVSPSASGMAWASSPGARCRAAGCPVAIARTPRSAAPFPAHGGRWPTATTSRCPRTSASSTPPSGLRSSPRRPASA